jgi:threonine dehydrogenase-like Zn-dependent dehydrogenase
VSALKAPTIVHSGIARWSSQGRVMMRALVYTPSIPRYVAARLLGKRYPVKALSLRLQRIPEPAPRPGFERLKVRLSGICGSDLALLYGKNAPSLSPFFSFPAVLGHEILAELGGVRVVVNPVLSCLERGLPECPACQRGEDHLCLNVAEGNLAPGMIGFCSDLPGGWSERILAHRERIHPVPEGVPDERAVLTEPLAVTLHGVRRAFEGTWPRELLIVGAGTIGLLTIKALRLLGFSGSLAVVARHTRQAELARLLGANQVYASVAAAQQAHRSRRYRSLLGGSSWRGGFEAVVEASGSPLGLQEASWAVEEGGRILLLGAPGNAVHDFSPYWFRELRVIGSYCYSWDDFALAVRLLPEAEDLEALISGVYPLEAWPDALQAALRHRGAKVLFRPQA